MKPTSRRAVGNFIDELSAVDVGASAFNPWSSRCDLRDLAGDAAAGRRDRLARFLDTTPAIALVGEAPGFQGCRYAGVPFTSEALMMRGRVPRIGEVARFTNTSRPMPEPTATMVFDTLDALSITDRVVTWNAFAFHPFKGDDPLTNRLPTDAELKGGLEIVQSFLALFPGVIVVAVGRAAQGSLSRIGVAAHAVRHPSNGGKPQFTSELAAIVKNVGCGRPRS